MSTLTTHVSANVFYTIAPELWEQIFLFTCTDGGYTGRSLSLISKRCHELSQSTRYHSLTIKNARMLVKFAVLLRGLSAGSDERGRDHGCSPAHSSSVSARRPKIRHLFVKLGDLFFELAEKEEEDDDDDFIYTGRAPRPPGRRWEYPESDEEGWTSGDDGTGSDEDPIEGEVIGGGEDVNSNDLDNDPEFLQAELKADVEWMQTDQGLLTHSSVPEYSDSNANFPPPLEEDHKIVEPQVLLLLQEVLTSPCCVDHLESLLLYFGFFCPIELTQLIPPYPRLKRLAIYSFGLISWGTFISHIPLSVPTPVPIVAHYPSLRTLRISGSWIRISHSWRVWRDNLLRFLKNHTPKLERLRAPIPGLQYGSWMNEVLSPSTGFHDTVYDALVEIEYPPPAFSLSTRFTSDGLDGFERTPSEDQDRLVIPSHSNRRLVLIDQPSAACEDEWLTSWEEEVGTDGYGNGDYDSKVWWKIPNPPSTTSWRSVGRVGNWELGLATRIEVVGHAFDDHDEWKIVIDVNV